MHESWCSKLSKPSCSERAVRAMQVRLFLSCSLQRRRIVSINIFPSLLPPTFVVCFVQKSVLFLKRRSTQISSFRGPVHRSVPISIDRCVSTFGSILFLFSPRSLFLLTLPYSLSLSMITLQLSSLRLSWKTELVLNKNHYMRVFVLVSLIFC